MENDDGQNNSHLNESEAGCCRQTMHVLEQRQRETKCKGEDGNDNDARKDNGPYRSVVNGRENGGKHIGHSVSQNDEESSHATEGKGELKKRACQTAPATKGDLSDVRVSGDATSQLGVDRYQADGLS